MAAVPPPPTPVLLYLGAGYDLSPLLTFSPSPPYQITQRPTTTRGLSPSRATYTSFLFADAKPRHTSAFAVPDFEEWIDVPSRVRNVMRYAQGMLDRWQLVDSDVICFEGGGSSAHVASRRALSTWHFVQPPLGPVMTSQPWQDHPPLITLLYAFNTLDIELAHVPSLARVWPHVTALYVHGLRPHPNTGLDRLMHRAVDSAEGSQEHVRVTHGLQHVYVIVGSWGTPSRGRGHGAGAQRGVRDVDFVKAAWRQWQVDKKICKRTFYSPGGVCCHALESDFDSEVDSDIDGHTPVVFRHPRPPWWDSSSGEWSEDDDNSTWTGSASPISDLTTASIIDSSCSQPASVVSRFSIAHTINCARRARTTFYTRIPQIAWNSTLRGGRGGYHVSKTVEESLAIWRARGDGLLETESEDGSEELNVEAGEVQSAADVDHDNINHPQHTTDADHNDVNHPQHTRRIHPRPDLCPRPAHVSRPTSASSAVRYSCSASSTDVSGDNSDNISSAQRPRLLRPFWRPGAKNLSGISTSQYGAHEQPITLSDFLSTPMTSASSFPSRSLSYSLCTLSCPDLKTTGSTPRSLRVLRALATIGHSKRSDNSLSSDTRRLRIGGGTNHKLPRKLGLLIRRPRTAPDRDCCESDATRVDIDTYK